MTVIRPMGIETEYGIAEAGVQANVIELSNTIVSAYAEAVPHAAWDYRGEDPLSDARGYQLPRSAADPSMLTDDPNSAAPSGPGTHVTKTLEGTGRSGPANAVLTNGARLYVDHAHPEYSSPEVLTPLDVVTYDRAGDLIMQRATELAARSGREIQIYKNNVDGKGASYGCHENYLISRDLPFGDVVQHLTTFFAVRPLICGAGRVGIGQKSEEAGFQISQRADYIENEVGLETTFNRPIINTRDEPHALRQWRRLHVIGGDANLFDYSNFLKVGTTAAVLWLLENGGADLELDSLAIADPVWETAEVSYDTSLKHEIALRDGSSATALQIQAHYARMCRTAMTRAGSLDPETEFLLDTWDLVIEQLSTDIYSAAGKVEWVAKMQMLEAMRSRGGLAWNDPKIVAFDLQWHDLRAGRSIVDRLDAAGRVDRLFTPEQVRQAATAPPENTRAFVRGSLIKNYPGKVFAASWDSITVDTGEESLLRIPTLNPLTGTKELVGEAVSSPSITDFLNTLRS